MTNGTQPVNDHHDSIEDSIENSIEDPIDETPTGADAPVAIDFEALPAEVVLHIRQLNAAVEEAEGARIRALADFKNFQRRSIENEARTRRDGASAVVRGLLPALDNLDLALQNAAAASSIEQVVEGITMLKAEIERGLESNGVEIIAPSQGDAFEPDRHEAVSQLAFEGIEEGRIGDVIQRGYALGEMVLRPAKVVLASATN